MTTGRALTNRLIPILVVPLPEGHETLHPLLGREITIGRDRANRIRIDDHFVSKFHAKLLVRRGEVTIIDLDSANKTRVNGEIIRERLVRIGDEIQFAGVRCQLRMPLEPSTGGAALESDGETDEERASRAVSSKAMSSFDAAEEKQVFWAGPPPSLSERTVKKGGLLKTLGPLMRRLRPMHLFVALIAILLAYALKGLRSL